MNTINSTYLSLGSNIGNRTHFLQTAVDLLTKQAGKIFSVSTVYSSSSWGFDGSDFYNICIGLQTHLDPQELLDCCLQIENRLGRERKESNQYTDRTIDIDILLFNDLVIDTAQLQIPHPEMKFRRFVLEPLAEIASTEIHPISKLSILSLLHYCSDKNQLEATQERIRIQKEMPFSNFNYLAIEGNIGAGKTTLSTRIAADFNGKLILEQFADNPFLPKFYENPDQFAFPLEMSFLAERYQQFCEDTTQLDLFKNFMISDYDVHKSLVFAKITLQEEEFKLYRKIFGLMYKETLKPDLYVYLHQNTERLKKNIEKRGRNYEQDISIEYLEKINSGYLEYIKSHNKARSLIIDISELDFVKNQADYEFIIDEIHNFTDN
ncbi:MAG: 2-amino-4-hydroxy-6-hydroxymethyldihydropteridine diphosphokinase [Flavobacteriaceae bacterium]|nr:2-amino-4-hydroxy-6-hydroxymethyldihydropteridine diphosphokinase [Flavobacteriaceae bacterium]